MKSIKDIDDGQLMAGLAWSLQRLHQEHQMSVDQVLRKRAAAVAFAAARILYTDDIDMPTGDHSLYDRLDNHFERAFVDWSEAL